MIDIKNKLFKNASIYLISNILSAFVPFILLPYLTSNFNTNDYGVLTLVTVIISFATPVIGMCIDGAILKSYYNKNIDFNEYLSNSLYIVILSFGSFYLISFLFGDILCRYFSFPSFCLNYIIVICFTAIINQIFLTVLRVRNKPLYYGTFQISISIINLITTIFFITYQKHNWEGRIEAMLISNLTFAILSTIIFFKKKMIFKNINFKYVKHILAFSLPLIPHTIGAMLIGFLSRIIIGKVLTNSDLGVFNVSYQFASILGIVFGAFNTGYVPWLFEKLKQKKENEIFLVRNSYKLTLFFIACFILFFVVIYFTFPLIINEKFEQSRQYIFLLLIAFLFNGIYYLFSNYIFYKEKTKYLAFSTGFIGILHIPITYYLTVYYGLYGGCLANIISYFLLLIITIVISNKVYPLPWLSELKKIIKIK